MPTLHCCSFLEKRLSFRPLWTLIEIRTLIDSLQFVKQTLFIQKSIKVNFVSRRCALNDRRHQVLTSGEQVDVFRLTRKVSEFEVLNLKFILTTTGLHHRWSSSKFLLISYHLSITLWNSPEVSRHPETLKVVSRLKLRQISSFEVLKN